MPTRQLRHYDDASHRFQRTMRSAARRSPRWMFARRCPTINGVRRGRSSAALAAAPRSSSTPRDDKPVTKTSNEYGFRLKAGLRRWMRLVALAVAIVPPVATVRAADPKWIVRGKTEMVATDSKYASQVGLDVLKAGGNAIDAAVAISFALGVTRPYSTGLGGGGFLVVRFPDGTVVAQDSRETAPAAATIDMFVEQTKKDPHGPEPFPKSFIGPLAIGVPGLLAGRCEALEKWGTMPLAQLIEPAAKLAEEGYAVDQHFYDKSRVTFEVFQKYPELQQTNRFLYIERLKGATHYKPGEIMRQPRLAKLLRAIAEKGPSLFYEGEVAEHIVASVQEAGGILSRADLAGYEVVYRTPVRTTFRDLEFIGFPPPSGGPIAIAEALNILDNFDLASIARKEPGAAMHLQLEAMKHAFADRGRSVGDPAFVSVPVKQLTSKEYADALARKILPRRAALPDRVGTIHFDDSTETSHFCIVDRNGIAVSSTETINGYFGSLHVVEEYGLIMNNEMDDFEKRVAKQLPRGPQRPFKNAIAPGKRPLSSMSPMIVMKDGRVYMLIGASGGKRIISSVLNVLVRLIFFDESVEDAMLALRPHHGWNPNQVEFDTKPPGALKSDLTVRGHFVSEERSTGLVQLILRQGGEWVGASDPRKGGIPAGR